MISIAGRMKVHGLDFVKAGLEFDVVWEEPVI